MASSEEENKQLRQENEQLKQQLRSLQQQNEYNNIRHSQEFWDDIEKKLIVDPDSIKQMIKNGTIKMEDKSPDKILQTGWTLIHYATVAGNYDICQLCLNLGAKPPKLDAWVAQPHHCDELISSSKNGANIRDKIEDITSKINQQNGIIENIMNELDNIGEQSKEIFNKIITEMMINIIQKKLIFSDDLLGLSWKIESNKGDPLQSEIWKTISKTCSDIIKNKNKRDWYWLKTYMLPSKVK